MKKILHLITGLEAGGGAEKMLLKTLPYLTKTENRVCCITGRGQIGLKLENKGIRVYYLEVEKKYDPRAIFRYRKVLKDYQPDLQVNYLIHADLFGRIWGKIFGQKKMIAYIRNKHLDLPFLLKLDKLTSKKIDFFLFNSNAVNKFYIENLKIDKFKTKCIPNGIDLEKFNFEIDWQAKRRELGLNENDFVLVNVARLYASKRQLDILKALKLINNPKIKFLIVGIGDQENNLKNFVKENNLEKQVKFLGLRHDVLGILKITDLFILASAHEGMSNALLEAMAMARPCLVSNIAENTELIKDQINGLNFEVKNFKNLAEKINFAINNIELMKDFGQKARQTIEQTYDIKKIIVQFDKFLEKFPPDFSRPNNKPTKVG